ncbi:MAG: molybdenum cofactor biosynthesis protein MoaE [Nitrospirae bacterium]|nr:molybdenum cofactor biosynthesis protein MoaE [Nitrospirota bacterium]
MIEHWIREIKAGTNPEELGMILIHNGIVRASSKDGSPVKGMNLTYDRERLKDVLADFKECDGIAEIRVWINEGDLKPGDDIMYVLVAGRFRTDVLPVFESLIARIKKEVVKEMEI